MIESRRLAPFYDSAAIDGAASHLQESVLQLAPRKRAEVRRLPWRDYSMVRQARALPETSGTRLFAICYVRVLRAISHDQEAQGN